MLRAYAVIALLTGVVSANEKIINVVIKSNMSDKRSLYYARGSSACWGIPGLAPQQDGSINVVPDEGNHACTCGDKSCDFYSHLLMPLYLDSKWDILHKHEELVGQIKFAAEAKKDSSGNEQWTYKCEVIDAETTHKISCDEVTSPDPSSYFKAYQVSLSDPSMISGVASTEPRGNCALYTIENGMCGEIDISCAHRDQIKDACPSARPGTCPSHGYTVKGDAKRICWPVVGCFTKTSYTKATQRFEVGPNVTTSTCNCFNTCLSRTWEDCCKCNDCAKDPAVAPHCPSDHVVV